MVARPRPAPVRVRLAAVDLDAPVVDAPVRAGELAIPDDPATAGWYAAGPSPGEEGSAVLAAHVDFGGQLGAFFHLEDAGAGDVVEVDLDDGSLRRFRVVSLGRFPRGQLPADELFAPHGPAGAHPHHLRRRLRRRHAPLHAERRRQGRARAAADLSVTSTSWRCRSTSTGPRAVTCSMIGTMAVEIAPFYVMEMVRAAEERMAAGGDVLHLEVGQPSSGAPAAVADAAVAPRCAAATRSATARPRAGCRCGSA